MRSLVILLVDSDGRSSPIYAAALRAGHRPVVAMGIDTATVVLGGLRPDVVIVRSTSPERDRVAVVRLAEVAVDVPIRVVDPDGGSILKFEDSAVPLN
jgi:AmiR/NasT family two-component response regulator